MTKRRVVKKNHPWLKSNPYSTKPKALKLIMSYIAENPNFQKSKRVTARLGVSTNTH